MALAGLFLAGGMMPALAVVSCGQQLMAASGPLALSAQSARASASQSSEARKSESQSAAENLVAEGAKLLRERDPRGAEAKFAQAVALAPNSPEAHHGLGVALWGEEKKVPAFQELRLAGKDSPGDADIHSALGRLAWELAQGPRAAAPPDWSSDALADLAQRELEKAVALRPKDFDLRETLAQIDLGRRRFKEALDIATAAEPLAATGAERERARLSVANALVSLGELEPGRSKFQSVLAADPSSGEAYFGLAQIHLLEQHPALARKDFELAIQVSPNFAPAYSALGELLAKAGDQRGARDEFAKAVALDPDYWQSRFQLAKAMARTGEAGQAAAQFQQVAKLHPDFLPAQEQLGLMALRRGDVNAAIAIAQKALRQDVQAAEGHRLMALVLWKQHSTEASLLECDAALTAQPDSATMTALRAIELWQVDAKREAANAFRQAVKLDPGAATAEGFCELLACGIQDITQIHNFLRQTRWVLQPPPEP